MAMAAAIGVGNEEDAISNRLASATNRLSGKRSLLNSRSSSASTSSPHVEVGGGMGDINRSIEKMTLAATTTTMSNGGAVAKVKAKTTTTTTTTNRRDSDWNSSSVSNEDQGYGSMKSDVPHHNNSRRCSDLSNASQVRVIFFFMARQTIRFNGGRKKLASSFQAHNTMALQSLSHLTFFTHVQVSNCSTRAVVNSSPWDASSSSASVHPGGAGANAGITHHLNRLHKKAQRQSVMSECQQPQQPMAPSTAISNPSSSSLSANTPPAGYGGRRASDPGRSLDRNFGVGGQMSRHRSGSYSGQQHHYQVRNVSKSKTIKYQCPHNPYIWSSTFYSRVLKALPSNTLYFYLAYVNSLYIYYTN